MLCPLLVALHTITWSLAILRGLATEWHISNYAIEVRFDFERHPRSDCRCMDVKSQ